MDITIRQKEERVQGERPERAYLLVRMTREEALATIASLAKQLENRDANTDRIEMMSRKGDFKGYFSIAVQNDPHCIECGASIEAYQGKLVKEGFCCARCKTPVERGRARARKMLLKGIMRG
jgi:predicted nucleic acid-binding Zn ribbon protein